MRISGNSGNNNEQSNTPPALNKHYSIITLNLAQEKDIAIQEKDITVQEKNITVQEKNITAQKQKVLDNVRSQVKQKELDNKFSKSAI
jgi:hypothetical protein